MSDKAINFLYIFVLIFSPLAFGSVEPWSLTIMEMAVFFALSLLFYKNFHAGGRPFYETPGMTPLLLFLLYIIFQIVPLPQEILRFVSPETYNIYDKTGVAGDGSSWLALSLDKMATLAEFFRFASYVAFYFITVQVLNDRERLRRTMTVVITFASVYAFFALLQHGLPNGKIYWLRSLPQGGGPFGSYINRNHYAGLMEMFFPVAIALFLYSKPEIDYGTLKNKLRNLLLNRRINDHVLFGFGAGIMAISIFLSLSRGAIVSLSMAMLLMGLFMIIKQRKAQSSLFIMVFSIFILFVVGWFGWDPIFARFHAIRDSYGNIAEMRPHIWQDTLLIIKDFTFTGSGFGSFAAIYPKYRSIAGAYTIDRAHNDYLEFISNGGIVGASLILSFLISLFYKSYRNFIVRRSTYSVYLYSGSAAGLVSILIHSLTDFNLHIGANGLYFFFLAGILVSSSKSSSPLRNASQTKYLDISGKKAFIICLILILTLAVFKISFFISNLYLAEARNHVAGYVEKGETSSIAREEALKKAIYFNPFNNEALFFMADMQVKKGNNTEAIDYINRAVNNNPTHASMLQEKGLILSRTGNKEGADKFLKTGVAFDKTNPARHQNYAFWLLSEKKDAEAAIYLRKAILLEPENTRIYIGHLTLNRRSIEYITHVLPEKTDPYLHLANYLNDSGRETRAIETIIKAAKFIYNEEKIEARYFIKIYYFLKRKKMYDKALNVMKKGVEAVPDDPALRVLAGLAYEDVNIKYRAMEEYERALVLDPSNRTARRRMEYLEK